MQVTVLPALFTESTLIKECGVKAVASSEVSIVFSDTPSYVPLQGHPISPVIENKLLRESAVDEDVLAKSSSESTNGLSTSVSLITPPELSTVDRRESITVFEELDNVIDSIVLGVCIYACIYDACKYLYICTYNIHVYT